MKTLFSLRKAIFKTTLRCLIEGEMEKFEKPNNKRGSGGLKPTTMF